MRIQFSNFGLSYLIYITFYVRIRYHTPCLSAVCLHLHFCRAARIDNFVLALKRLHAEFHWPYPLLLSSVLASITNTAITSPTTSEDVRKSSNSSGMSSTLVPTSASNSSPNPMMNNLGVKKHVLDGLQSTPAGISDSGYKIQLHGELIFFFKKSRPKNS